MSEQLVTVSERVMCPVRAGREEVTYLAGVEGRPLVVLRCTRFHPPHDVQCAWPCGDRLALSAGGSHLPR